jgi:hypothetical protein
MGTMTAATAGAAAAAPVTPVITQVTAAHHPGYDRLVFTFRGGVPSTHAVRYVTQVTADPSGLPVNVVGSAKLLVTFKPAAAHTVTGVVTYGPTAHLRAARSHPGGQGG